MTKKLTIEEVKNKIKEVHGDIIEIDELTYINTNTTCRFVDKEYGEFWNDLNNVVNRNQSHPARKINKIKQTCLKKYGVESVFLKKEIREKCKDSIKVTIEEIKKRLYEIYGDLVLIKEETYISTNKHAIFIDKDYGEWSARVCNVVCSGRNHPERGKKNQIEKYKQLDQKELREKTKKTCLEKYGIDCSFRDKDRMRQCMKEKYGVENSQQVPEIALKTAKSSNNSYILYHWKSGTELVCVGSYEKKTVEYLNENKIEYDWQPKIFIMPDGRTYRPDLYLIDKDLWVEIKGYFRKDAQEKWEWFHKEHINSELWMEDKIKELLKKKE